MEQERIHRAITEYGTEIAGRVYGQGPPLVLLHGPVDDGESEWEALVPLLSDRFTCYVPSTQGRGLSGAHGDPSREARVRDVTAFIESIGEPVHLAGASGGGMVALGVAARTPAVTAVAVQEPVVLEVMGEETRARFLEVIALMERASEEGGMADAAVAFLEFVANEEEAAALSADPTGLEAAGRYLPLDLEEFREAFHSNGPSPTDPSVLGRIAAPVLLLHGSRTGLSWFRDGVRFVAEHVPDARVREIDGVGHFGHQVQPDRIAAEIVPFYEGARQGV